MNNEYAHNEHYKWIESNYNVKCSDLGKEVANILGYVGNGIYNAPFDTKKVKWENNQCIEINWNHSLSNWDSSALTKLIIECHRRMIRVTISPNMCNLKLQFWQRKSRVGTISERLPDIEEMIEIQDSHWSRNKIEHLYYAVKQPLKPEMESFVLGVDND